LLSLNGGGCKEEDKKQQGCKNQITFFEVW
jgi:hypothetical protein